MLKSLCLAALAAATTIFAAAPVLAGDIVVPLASNQGVQDLTYVTRVWVVNPSSSSQTFTAVLFLAGADGTVQPPASKPQIAPPGKTLVYSSAAAPGATGMLSLRGASVLQVAARLETRRGQQLLGAVEVPAITADNVFAANATAHLAGIERAAGQNATDFYVFNLDTAAAHCTVKVFQASGPQIAGTAQITMAPRQRRDFTDVLSILGQSNLTDARLETSCDHRFWIGGLLRRSAAPATLLVPTAQLAKELLGAGDPPPPPPADGTVTLTVPGLFLNAKQGDSYRSYQLPAKSGVPYETAVVEFDLLVKQFGSGNFTGVHSLRRSSTKRTEEVLYYGLQINNYKARTILDLGQHDQLAKGDVPWESSHSYHLRFTYDLTVNKITIDVFEGGAKKQSVSGSAHNFDLRDDGHPLIVDFGMEGVGGDGGYVPPLGWQYSNLKAVLTP